jgi:hypothetical protein
MGSSQSLGPWSVMQAALQGGAATSRPWIPNDCGGMLVWYIGALNVAAVASDGASSSMAAKKYLVFIFRSSSANGRCQ